MHLERTAKGDWMIDPEQLSSRLAINSGQMRQKMRLGLVTSRIYKGIDEHAGTWRVTVRIAMTEWEGIFNETGELLNERIL
jgi:hypothetical protein